MTQPDLYQTPAQIPGPELCQACKKAPANLDSDYCQPCIINFSFKFNAIILHRGVRADA